MTSRQPGLTGDARLLVAGQGVRAAGYGFTAVLLGALLADRGYSHLQVGVVLTALIAGTALASLAVGRFGDRFGRRRSYGVFFCGIAVAGVVVAAAAPEWVLLAVALTGTLSTDVVDNGPATTLEQAMLAAEDAGTARVYGRYNAVGAAAGALGALAVILPGLGPKGVSGGVHAWLFLVLVPVGIAGAVLAARLSPAVEAPTTKASTLEPVTRARFGLVATMVGTHLPSNLLLASVAFAPTFAVAALLLLARTTLSQMDVPTRQALVMTVVTPDERTAAAAVTNAARYTVRPIGPLVAGLVQELALGAPLVVAGAVKAGYDLTLWGWARHLGLTSRTRAHRSGTAAGTAMTTASGEPQ
jgi:MFS family permease